KNHSEYLSIVDDLKEKQSVCFKSIKHEKNYAKIIRDEIKKYLVFLYIYFESFSKTASFEETKRLNEMLSELDWNEFITKDMYDSLPNSSGLYLKIVLGHVNVSLTNKQDRYLYKHDYERFKIIISAISATLSFLLYFFIHSRVMDTAFHFLLVWYYCTLTIREQILIVNGSRIKGWWVTAHFISTAAYAIMLIWYALFVLIPRPYSLLSFYFRFGLFNLFNSCQ
ncbi:unnamed protein product, partial [Protopolystoma xenopodis]